MAPAAVRQRDTRPFLTQVGERLWRTFCSLKLLVVLLLLSFAAIMAGTFIIQAPIFVQDIPFLYQEWLAFEAERRFGDAAPVMDQLGLFTIYQSAWFQLLMVLLTVQIIICTVNRWPAIRKAWFEPQVRRNDAFYEKGKVRRLALPGGVDALTRVLQRHRYRVITLQEGSTTFLYADRNGWAKLATFAGHLGLVLMFIGGMVSSTTAFEREILIPDRATAPLFPVSAPDQVQILNERFVVERYPDGRPSDFYSDLVLFQGGQQVAQKRIRVNDPLDYNGFVFYQAGFGRSVELEIEDRNGVLLFGENFALTGQFGDIPFREIPIPQENLRLVVALVPEETIPREANVPRPIDITAAEALTNRLVILGFRLSDGAGPLFSASPPPGESVDLGVVSIRNLGEGFFTGLRVRKDPGVNILLAGALLFIVFESIILFFPRRRLWARIQGDEAILGGNADRFIDLPKEMDEIQADAGATTDEERPLASTPS